MNKIIGILMLIVIGGTEIICLGICYVAAMILLLLNEIVGTKKFVKKFRKLNKIVYDEFMGTIKCFKDLFEESI